MARERKPPAYYKTVVHGNTRAACTLYDAVTKRRKVYLFGPYGTPESRERYARLIATWEASGRRLPEQIEQPPNPTMGPTVSQLCYAFWLSAGHYCEQRRGLIQTCIRILRNLYGSTAAAAFGPQAFRLVREEMISRGWRRKTVTAHTDVVRQIFRWGVSHELIPVSTLEAIRTVEPLKRGQTEAPESEPIRPVPAKMLKATLPHLGRQVRAVVELQILTGARPSELLSLRRRDILCDEMPGVWITKLGFHKTAHYGRDRTLYFGPQAQAILRPFMDRAADAFLFSPIEAEAELLAERLASRTTPLSRGNRPGTNRKESPRRKPRDHYDVASYRRAITRACEKAFPPPEPLAKRDDETWADHAKRISRDGMQSQLKAWKKSHHWHPHQLRHNAATALRREFGLEAAQLILGHSSAQITDAVYADRDQEKILKIVQKTG